MRDTPTTRVEAEKHRYGAWAGFPKGHAYDPSYCVEHVFSADRAGPPGGSQCGHKPGHGPAGLYCKQHDPAAVRARVRARQKRYDDQRERECPQWYGHEMLTIIRQIADGHNDPASLCRAFIKTYDGDAP